MASFKEEDDVKTFFDVERINELEDKVLKLEEENQLLKGKIQKLKQIHFQTLNDLITLFNFRDIENEKKKE